jgi:DNA topoisomerase I (EC 5.99.1.2)
MLSAKKGYLFPTDLGILIIELLVQYFPKEMDFGFTATMEEELDKVEEGKIKWQKVIKEFYEPFQKRFKNLRRTI